MSEYGETANNFLLEHGIVFKVEFLGYRKHFVDDKECRDCYRCTFIKGETKKVLSVDFGQSIVNSGDWLVNDKLPKFRKVFADKVSAHNYAANIGNRFNVIKNPNKKEPTAYDVLACITKNNPGKFEDFCSEFGYSDDSIRAKEVWQSVKDEYLDVREFFTDIQLEQLQDIN